MNVHTISTQLAELPVPQVRYFAVTGSTNDEALRWAADGAQDGCLVVANQQTQGRGRLGRRWITQPGSALAFSLILKPNAEEQDRMGFFSPLGALAICQALEEMFGLSPSIKWPNDVLLNRKKTAGILVEAAWFGSRLQALVVGIGVNVNQASVPHDREVRFPATSIEEAAGQPVERLELLKRILKALFAWRVKITSSSFRQAWEQHLAFVGEWVHIEETTSSANNEPISGQVIGLNESGSLILNTQSGDIVHVAVGDVHLRPSK